MAVPQDDEAFLNFLQEFENLWHEILPNFDRNGGLLRVGTWNPNPDGDLTRAEAKKCLYGTLGVMEPDVICLQETIWVPPNFCDQLLQGEPFDRRFSFLRICSIKGSKEAAILYNPAIVEVVETVDVDEAWRRRAQLVWNGLGVRTVALQGRILSNNRYRHKI
jgi:hypothetical protein